MEWMFLLKSFPVTKAFVGPNHSLLLNRMRNRRCCAVSGSLAKPFLRGWFAPSAENYIFQLLFSDHPA